jgi:hypothetical protein
MKLTKGKINKIKKRQLQSKKRNNRHRNKNLVKDYNDQSFRKKRHVNLKNQTLKRFGIFGGDRENDDKQIVANRIDDDDKPVVANRIDDDNETVESNHVVTKTDADSVTSTVEPKLDESVTEPVVEAVPALATTPVTPITPIIPVTPITPIIPVTPITPVTPVTPVDASNKNVKTEQNNEIVQHIPDKFGPTTSMEEVADYFANIVLLKLVSKFDVNTNMNLSDLMHTLADKNNSGTTISETSNSNNSNNSNNNNNSNNINTSNTSNDVKSFFDNINTNYNPGVDNNTPTNNPTDLNFSNRLNGSNNNFNNSSNEYPYNSAMGMGMPIGMPMGMNNNNNEEKFENKQRKDETYGEYLNRVEAHENKTGDKIVRQEPTKETGEAYGASFGLQSEREKAQHKADLEAFCKHEPTSKKCNGKQVIEPNIGDELENNTGNQPNNKNHLEEDEYAPRFIKEADRPQTIENNKNHLEEDEDAPRFIKEADRPQTIEKIEPSISNAGISGSRIDSDIDEGSKRISTSINEGISHVGNKLNEGASHVGNKLNEGISHVGNKLNEGASHVGNKLNEGASHVGNKLNEGASHIGNKLNKGASHIKNMGKSGFSAITRRFGRRGGNSNSNKTKKLLQYN